MGLVVGAQHVVLVKPWGGHFAGSDLTMVAAGRGTNAGTEERVFLVQDMVGVANEALGCDVWGSTTALSGRFYDLIA